VTSDADFRLPRLLFVHIPKTAGTSMTEALAGLYGALTFPAMTTLDYAAYDDARLLQYRLFKGHAYRRDYKRLPPDTRRLTVLRDPVERAISFWRYYRSLTLDGVDDPYVAEAIRLAQSRSPLELIYSESPFVLEHLRLGQVRQFLPGPTLHAIGHRQFVTGEMKRQALADFIAEIDRFDVVLTCEMLRVSLAPAHAALGLPPPAAPLPRVNISPGTDAVDRLEVRRAMMDVSDAEFACYEHARRREIALLGG